MMAFQPLFLFALLVLIFGNGAFKPKSRPKSAPFTLPAIPRRGGAYSIFYVGIIRRVLAPLVAARSARKSVALRFRRAASE